MSRLSCIASLAASGRLESRIPPPVAHLAGSPPRLPAARGTDSEKRKILTSCTSSLGPDYSPENSDHTQARITGTRQSQPFQTDANRPLSGSRQSGIQVTGAIKQRSSPY
ncbi:hypothetical protein ETB97_012470 [Aspergillus alliaceus]|uniref:Uncharacterized protein n=1 Tax=Petromyces alliaceus TaxID=209559 RepID=A0A8H6AEE6_PETAA|nr:hypothetical protein ETB97_012470 [Aspergillus burnettii]